MPPHARADPSLQLGDVSGFTFVGSFPDITPEVEIRRREIQRPRWPPGGGASGDEPPPEALLEPLEGSQWLHERGHHLAAATAVWLQLEVFSEDPLRCGASAPWFLPEASVGLLDHFYANTSDSDIQ